MSSANKKTCFVVMPISDPEGYESGHFSRVYDHLIKPACVAAGLVPVRSDEVKGTNYIAIDILQRILNSDLVVCDLSGKNPNVMYELGIRQAFDLPAVLLKDRRTERVFDIQGLRTIEYSESLRIDSVTHDGDHLKQAIVATMNPEKGEVNSLVRLLGVEKASVGDRTELSPEISLVLSAIKDVSVRISAIEESPWRIRLNSSQQRSQAKVVPKDITLPNGTHFQVGDMVSYLEGGRFVQLGTLVDVSVDGLVIKPEKGNLFIIPPDDPKYNNLSDIPF
jgi:hypothetical protein